MYPFILIGMMALLNLSACASYVNSQTDASSLEDRGNKVNGYESDSISDLPDLYQNSSQTTKGAVIGGATGGAVGSVISSIGTLPGLAIGSVFGASYGAYLDAHGTLQQRLDHKGVIIVETGDYLRVVIPSSRLFVELTGRLKSSSRTLLEAVIEYLNSEEYTVAQITAHTAKTGSPLLDKRLSTIQADEIVKYLSSHHLNARLITGEGMGGNHLVENNQSEWGSSLNYRIEITLQRLKD